MHTPVFADQTVKAFIQYDVIAIEEFALAVINKGKNLIRQH